MSVNFYLLKTSHGSACFHSLCSSSSHCTLNIPFPHKEDFKQSFSYSSAIFM